MRSVGGALTRRCLWSPAAGDALLRLPGPEATAHSPTAGDPLCCRLAQRWVRQASWYRRRLVSAGVTDAAAGIQPRAWARQWFALPRAGFSPGVVEKSPAALGEQPPLASPPAWVLRHTVCLSR